MSFALPTAGLLLGLGAIAFGLYLLQRLRVRHRATPVVTTMFWKEAVEESRARVLVRRFRHPWAYALFLAICTLLWLGFAQPRSEDEADRTYVLLLDGSAEATPGDTFAASQKQLEDDLGSLPRDGTRVLFCGAHTRCLLAPGEDPLLLRKRWADLAPEACRPTVPEQVRSIAAHSDPARPTTIRLYGGAALPNDVIARLPAHVRVERSGDVVDYANGGISALGVSAAASGAWNRVDVFVATLAKTNAPPSSVPSAGPSAAPFTVLLDGTPYEATVERENSPSGRWHLRDVPASGQVLTLRLNAKDKQAFDDEASVVLPVRKLIRVRVEGYMGPVIAPVIESDPALVLVESDEDVLVTADASVTGPALTFIGDNTQRDPIVVRGDWAAGAVDPLVDVGLGDIEEVEPEGGVARRVTIAFETGTTRRISVWDTLLTNRFSLGHSRVFPLFVSTALRWLGGSEDILRYAAAGEPLRTASRAWKSEDGTILDPVGAPFTPPRAGIYTDVRGRTVAAPLLAAAPPKDAAVLDAVSDQGVGVGADVATWLLLLAFVLLLGEWVLVRWGRVP